MELEDELVGTSRAFQGPDETVRFTVLSVKNGFSGEVYRLKNIDYGNIFNCSTKALLITESIPIDTPKSILE